MDDFVRMSKGTWRQTQLSSASVAAGRPLLAAGGLPLPDSYAECYAGVLGGLANHWLWTGLQMEQVLLLGPSRGLR